MRCRADSATPKYPCVPAEVMPRSERTVSPAMDRRWLEEAARTDPVRHAYALWDLDYAPERVEFRVLREKGVPLGYLLIWHGLPVPMVHWVAPDEPDPLLDALPPRPLVAVVPPTVAGYIEHRRAPSESYPVMIMARGLRAFPPLPSNPAVRRLGPRDRPAVQAFAAAESDRLARAYERSSLESDASIPLAAWGAFDGERIVGVASTQVMLPSVWVLGGIFVRSEYRRRGLGRDLTAAAVAEADRAGARTALYVREDNTAAVRAYERVGFAPVDRRIWIDAGGNRAP